MASTSGRRVIEALTNKSGGAIIAGDVVIVDTANDSSFTTTTTAGFTGTVGVAQESIASLAVGRVCTAGQVELVNVNASVTRGNFGKTHTVAKQATDAGASRAAGAFCQFLTGGTTPKAHLFGIVDASTSSSGVPAGTSFPGTPANNDLFYRTDLDLLFFYDGTRWLTTTLYTDIMPTVVTIPISATSTVSWSAIPLAGSLGVWFEGFWVTFFVTGGTALGASHNWVVAIVDKPASTTLATYSINSGASDTWRNSGTVGTPAAIATTEFAFSVSATKTGTPGTLYPLTRVSYRLIGT